MFHSRKSLEKVSTLAFQLSKLFRRPLEDSFSKLLLTYNEGLGLTTILRELNPSLSGQLLFPAHNFEFYSENPPRALESFLFKPEIDHTFSNEFAKFEEMNVSRFDFMQNELPHYVRPSLNPELFTKNQLIIRVHELALEISKKNVFWRQELETKDELKYSQENSLLQIQKILQSLQHKKYH